MYIVYCSYKSLNTPVPPHLSHLLSSRSTPQTSGQQHIYLLNLVTPTPKPPYPSLHHVQLCWRGSTSAKPSAFNGDSVGWFDWEAAGWVQHDLAGIGVGEYVSLDFGFVCGAARAAEVLGLSLSFSLVGAIIVVMNGKKYKFFFMFVSPRFS